MPRRLAALVLGAALVAATLGAGCQRRCVEWHSVPHRTTTTKTVNGKKVTTTTETRETVCVRWAEEGT